MIKKFLTFVALCMAIISNTNAQTIFSSSDSDYPYRIPAIATLKNGKVLAISDYRPCYKDVGNGEVDMYAKIANLNADGSFPSNATATRIADGNSNNGYGDAALVVDRESGNVLVICVAGKQVFSNGSSSKHNKMARIVAEADQITGAITWQSPQDVTTAFFDNLLPKAYTMFMASGRMIQSQLVKIGNYYRIYGALLVKESGGNNNYVVYSDDFGASWTILGDAKAISSGDEAKVEELPNGDIVVSSRTSAGRIFNVYSMETGTWGSQETYTFGGANCNGELLFYKGLVSKADGKTYNVMLQSLPAGTSGNEKRSEVTVFYKAFATDKKSWEVSDFTSKNSWAMGIKVDSETSAYSTMTILPNGNIGFLYEDGEVKFKHGTLNLSTSYGYDITFRNITVEEITGEAFTLPTPVVKTVATPTITPDGGNIFDTQEITLSCTTEEAAIYYTTDGTEPTSSSTLYTGPFTLNESAVVKAIAAKEDYDNSQVVAANFNVTKAGTTYRFKNVQKNGTCYYFTYDASNGIGLTTNVDDAALYVRGEGTKAGTYTYQTADGNYLIFSGRDVGGQSCNKGYNDGNGFLTSYESAKCDLTVAQLVAGGEVDSFEGTYYTITGQRDYKKYSSSTAKQEQAYFVITSDGKFDGATEPYYNDDYSSAFIIEEVKNEPVVKKVATPVFSLPSGTYDEGTKLSVTCATEGAKIYLALDANWPAEEWVEYSEGMLEICENSTLYAIAKLDGWEDSDIASAEYTAIMPLTTPVINPASGKVENGTKVTVTCAIEGATIYYTTDGTEPTTESAVYSAPIVVNEEMTIKAFAVKVGYTNSAVATASYTIKETETPTFSGDDEVVAGTAITITCATEGATIYYTTDGTEPTTESAVYSAPIVVNEDMTIKAFAVKDGYINSAVATASYTIIVINEYTVKPGTGILDNTTCYLTTFSASEPTVVPVGVTAFYATIDNDNNITLISIGRGKAIPAGEGVILKASNSKEFKMTTAKKKVPEANLSGNRLVGTCDIVNFTFEKDGYALTVKGSGSLKGQYAFSKISAGRTLSNYNNRAYLDLSTSSIAFSNNFRLSFGGITGIESIAEEETEEIIYDLSGRRVTEMEPGNIYIVNGKKVLKK